VRKTSTRNSIKEGGKKRNTFWKKIQPVRGGKEREKKGTVTLVSHQRSNMSRGNRRGGRQRREKLRLVKVLSGTEGKRNGVKQKIATAWHGVGEKLGETRKGNPNS